MSTKDQELVGRALAALAAGRPLFETVEPALMMADDPQAVESAIKAAAVGKSALLKEPR